MELAEQHCEPCRNGGQPLTFDEAHRLMAQMSGWQIAEDGKSISRRWDFKNFADSLEFINRVGLVAEAENHHPDIEFGWGYAKLTLMTHDVGGLHANDFILAAKINQLK